jgi:hypothetical protein
VANAMTAAPTSTSRVAESAPLMINIYGEDFCFFLFEKGLGVAKLQGATVLGKVSEKKAQVCRLSYEANISLAT